jgi:hypothetical protein
MQSAYPVLYCHPRPVSPFPVFPHELINDTIFETNVIEHKICVVPTTLKRFNSKKNGARYYEYHTCTRTVGLHVKNPLFLLYFNETWIISVDCRKYSNMKLMKVPSVEHSCSMRTEGQAEMTKLIVASRNFANATKNWWNYYCSLWYVSKACASTYLLLFCHP